MSVSHVTPSFLHSHRHVRRHTERRSRTELQRRHRENLVLAGLGVFLLGAVVAGFIGMAVTVAPTSGPSSGYGTDGATYVAPPGWAVFWLAVTLISVVALFAYGIATAVHNQQ